MPGRERRELPALTEEEYSGGDEQPARARLHDLCEGGMEFTLVGGVHHQDLPSDGTSRFLQVSRLALDIRTVWVTQHGDD
jgi:c-di-GMP-binding flagellar brake protein YcgR